MTPTADRRVVLAHGFTQTAASWSRIQALLAARGITSHATDMPGHGTAARVEADLEASAERLVRAGGRATYIGYSMGGRVALHAALSNPESVERLVLIGATAGLDDEAERDARRASDERLADHLVSVGIERFIDEWLATPLFAHLTPEQAGRDLRVANTAAGLASSLRLAGTGTQQPLWDRLDQIEVSTLLIVGERDAKFRRLAERMDAHLRHSLVAVVAGAGHSVHLEAPEATVDVIVAWLDQAVRS